MARWQEDEQGTVGDMGDSGARPGGRGLGIKVQCPECGESGRVALPQGIRLAEVEDENEAGSMRTLRGSCRNCEATFEIAPPEGYEFASDEADEDEDETTGARFRGSKQSHGREAIVTFKRRYAGRSHAADMAPDALTCFRESYQAARRAGRDSALPPQ